MGEGSPKKSAASLLFHVVPPPTFSTSFHIVVLPSLSPDLLLLLLIALVTTCNGLRLTSLFQPARQRRESACCITRSNSRNILCVHVLLLWPLTALHESTALDKRIPYPPFSLSADDAYPSGNNECKLCASRRPSVRQSFLSFIRAFQLRIMPETIGCESIPSVADKRSWFFSIHFLCNTPYLPYF